MPISEKRRAAVFESLEREKAIRALLKQGLQGPEIRAQLDLSVHQWRHTHARLMKRENGALARLATIKANDSYRLLDDMAVTAHGRREEDNGWQWIKAGVAALDVLGRQAGIGRQDTGSSVVVQVMVPVLGPGEAAKAGEIVDGTVLRVITGDTPGGSLNGDRVNK